MITVDFNVSIGIVFKNSANCVISIKMCANPETENTDIKTIIGVQDEEPQTNACASSAATTGSANVTECNGSAERVAKKRKTRRGKPKRRNLNPYAKSSFQQRKNKNFRKSFNRKYRSNKIIAHGQAFAPYNSNQFLMEDHGELQELDSKLSISKVASTSMAPRTRDSSFSVDSDVDFYSSPEDEEEFLTKEFDIEYEECSAERLQAMSKTELIGEFIGLENKVDALTKKLLNKQPNVMDGEENENVQTKGMLQQQIHKLTLEIDELRRENEHLRGRMCRSRSRSSYSSSMDSESDSSTSCSTMSTDNELKETPQQTPPNHIVEHVEMDGHTEGYSPRASSPTHV